MLHAVTPGFRVLLALPVGGHVFAWILLELLVRELAVHLVIRRHVWVIEVQDGLVAWMERPTAHLRVLRRSDHLL